MRRTFILSSVLVAALSVACSAIPVSAGAIALPPAFTAASQHAFDQSHPRASASTLNATAVSAGTSPSLLQMQPGVDELASIAKAGSGNPAVTTPADPSLAAGPNNVVEAVNSALQVTPRTGTSPPVVMNINAMIGNTSTWDVRYPHVIYDPASGRFILAVLQFDPTLLHCGAQIAVMESQSNPGLAWISRGQINIDPELGGGVEFSNVSLGLTANLVVESSDYASCTTGLPVASQTTVIQRSDLTTGTLTTNSSAFLAGGPVGLQPAMAVSASSVAYEVANDANCSAVASGSIAVIAITGTPDAKTVGHTCTAESETATTVPLAAAQSGTSATLITGTDRFESAVWQGNLLWVAGNTACTPSGDSQMRSCLNVESIPASSTGTVGAATPFPEGVSGSYLYDPAIALDSAGDAVLTFDKSSSTAFESMMVAAITGGVWSSLITLHASTSFYSPSACSSCAWGDYSAAVQDAAHPTDVWVLSEETDGDTGTGCANANTCWDTYIGRYTFAGPAISALTPSSGPRGGGQNVTVFGSDFENSTSATFGPTSSPSPPAIAISNITPDSFTFTTPPGPAAGGFYELIATGPLGSSSATSTASAYLYIPLTNYTAVTPFRILDTRSPSQGPAFGPAVTRTLQITGVGATPVPSTAVVVVLNVTAVAGTASSLLSLYPAGSPPPSTSALNFKAGSVTPNLVTVALGSGGAVKMFNAAGTVNVVVDVEGYFAPPGGPTPAGEFHPISPTRVCDTRSASYACHGAIVGGIPRLVTVAQGAIPNTGTAAAAVLNLTAVAGSAATYLTVYPTSSNGTCATGKNLPVASTINVTAGEVAANRVMVLLGPTTSGGLDTSVCVYSALGSINVVLDANGWFGSATAPTGYQYQAAVPTRICDTRSGSQSCAAGSISGVSRLVGVAGQGGVPAVGGSNPAVQAVIANLTGIAPTLATYLVAYSASLTKAPGSSDISLRAGDVRGNLIVVQLDTTAGAHDGFIELFNAAGSANVAVDIEGWFQ